ncbi:MAG: RelA/SpoT family protein [Bacteroidetes bacterium]|nr:MAG: RelA/SpoT family protein [Bacteroidota bacterium]
MEKMTPEQERLEILRRYRRLIEVWHTRKTVEDRWMVRKAFRLAADAHRDMRRKTGEAFIFHPIEVATIAAGEIGLGRTSIISALLHDTVEDTTVKLEDISRMFGTDVAKIIDGLTKIDVISDKSSTAQAETLKKILFTLTDDVRVILIKLADRLHNLRTMDVMPREKQLKVASETFFLYSPLAHRLGLYAIKTELEELSFKYSQPQIWKDIKEKIDGTEEIRQRIFSNFVPPVEKELEKLKLKFDIRYHVKSAYSIWQKMQEDQMPFEEIYNTFSVEVIVDSDQEKEKLECWAAYSVITGVYTPNNKKLRDWISTPKANGYEAIHTTVMCPDGHWVDVHIRSKRMDDIAMKGYAAHWKYKDQEKLDAGLDKWLKRTRELLKESEEETIDFINDFKKNLFEEEIVVFTPKGDMITMPAGATVLDFAYAIHTELGNHCIGANVNHKLVPIDYQLKSGDQVQIIDSKVQLPNEDWFDYVRTARAKTRIKVAIKHERKKYRSEGKEKLKKYLDQLKLDNSKAIVAKLVRASNLKGSVDLYYYIALNKITIKNIKEILVPHESLASWVRNIRLPFVKPKIQVLGGDGLLTSEDESLVVSQAKKEVNKNGEFTELDYSVSKCCNPIPGDDVIGLIFPNEPIRIHKTDCENAIKLMSQYGKNIVKAKWKQQEGITFLAGLSIQAVDNIGLAQKITSIISNDFNVSIRSLNLLNSKGLVNMDITIYINSTEKLKKLIQHLKKIKEVIKVSRLDKIS